MADEAPKTITFNRIITELVLDPTWSIGRVTMEGAAHPIMRIIHPRHGEIVFTLPMATVEGMAKALLSLIPAKPPAAPPAPSEEQVGHA